MGTAKQVMDYFAVSVYLLLINNMGTALLALCFCALSLVLALFVGISPKNPSFSASSSYNRSTENYGSVEIKWG